MKVNGYSAMFQCPKCLKDNVMENEICVYCGQPLQESKKTKSQTKVDIKIGAEKKDNEPVEEKRTTPRNNYLADRYKDAYRIAKSIISFGIGVKLLAWIVGGIVVFIGILALTQSNQYGNTSPFGWMGIIWGFATGFSIYILGIFISALGQLLKAVLDTAVNTSKLLTKEEMDEILR